MKTVLVLAAAIGFSISAAAAECMGHSKVTASVDTETTVASVTTDTSTAPDAETIKKEEARKAE